MESQSAGARLSSLIVDMDSNSFLSNERSAYPRFNDELILLSNERSEPISERSANPLSVDELILFSNERRESISERSAYPLSNDELTLVVSNERRESTSDRSAYPRSSDELTLPRILDGSIDETLQDPLRLAISEAENAKREAKEEAVRRQKAEKDALSSTRMAKALEILYEEESRNRKEMKESLEKERKELDMMRRRHDELAEALRAAKSQISSMQLESDHIGNMEQKFFSAMDLLQKYKREREELQVERDNATKEAEELRREREEGTSSRSLKFFSEFSFSEIEAATKNFDPLSKIGKGGYGSIYKGMLRNTDVAIKMLHAQSVQGPWEFQEEVDVFSKLRHPNLVTLIGACPEACALVYEYLPNGSLEDRLGCENNSTPLSWQTRIRIATELCSVLAFLHSSKPHAVVHGGLKPSSVLLDANFVSKLSDFSICRMLFPDESSGDDTTTDCPYMDPEFHTTGELTSKSDVYSFGIILLQLLTGKSAVGISREVQCALDEGNLETVLDPIAGDWPFVQAEQLTRLALRCCEDDRINRADLESDVFRVLEPMRASSGGSSSLIRSGSGEHCQPPSYFICPIFQEVMEDPHVAADGFTYEAEALKGWLDSGHDTSPMTNLKLEHFNLTPNYTLRSAIREWLQQH